MKIYFVFLKDIMNAHYAIHPNQFTYPKIFFRASIILSHTLNGTPNVNALYCRRLQFAGSTTESADLDINGLNVYVLERVTWADNSYTETPGELPVSPVHIDLERWTSLWDDSADPGQAFVGQGISPNDPPVAAAGPDQSVVDADGDGYEDVQLDGMATR